MTFQMNLNFKTEFQVVLIVAHMMMKGEDDWI